MNRFCLARIRLEDFLNNLSLKKKLRYLYYFCILVPIILTDIVILYAFTQAEHAEQQHQMEKIVGSVQSMLAAATEDSSLITTSLYMDNSLQDFVSRQYASPREYFDSYKDYISNSLLQGISRITNSVITVYADNETLINGSEFRRLSAVSQELWYQQYTEDGYSPRLLFSYDDTDGRQVLFLRGMNGLYSDKAERLVCIELNYSTLERDFQNMGYDYDVYVCSGNQIVLTNATPNYRWQPYSTFSSLGSVGLSQHLTLYGEELNIYVLEPGDDVLMLLRTNIHILILLLLLNIIPPQLLMNLLENSITSRLFRLEKVFNQVDSDVLIKISGPSGQDEIGRLMDNYNHMADRMNSLIDIVYRCRLKEQEMDIARQNAELMALYSQINPHFLFNALESIRMHSILKKEDETADMVQKLAIMARQNVDWSSDSNTIKRELAFVEAYLALQKYRFGERLSYKISAQEDCKNILVPKLTITTFVENACVHGIETKSSPGWIFVRVYTEDHDLCIDIEDTGGGMDEAEVERIQDRMQNANLMMLKEKGRIGMVNTCLRIRMMTENTAQFSVESESGIGTLISIRFPLNKAVRAE